MLTGVDILMENDNVDWSGYIKPNDNVDWSGYIDGKR